MRVLWHSNAPWCGSGYGVQTAHGVRLLSELGHEAVVSASFGLDGNSINIDGVTVMPGMGGGDPYGARRAPLNGRKTGADVIVTLLDAWVFSGELFRDAGQRWIALAPVDHDPIPPAVAKAVKGAWRVATFARSGIAAMGDVGLDPLYMPHAYDPAVMRPMDAAGRAVARERLGIPADAYLFGVVAANKGTPSRKNFPALIEAFARVHKAHPDTLLALHTRMDPSHGGLDLFACLEWFGIPGGAVKFADQDAPAATNEHMAALYNACDVLVNPAHGEGFGVPILEAQACGTPVIVGDWTSMSELIGPHSWGIAKDGALRTWTIQQSFQWQAGADVIAERMLEAYDRGHEGDTTRRETAAFAGEGWSLPAVLPVWREAWEAIDADLSDGPDMPDAAPVVEVVE